MTTKSIQLEPRLSVLEANQEIFQRELMQLSSVVKDQGAQLTTAIANLATAHTTSYNNLSEKISSMGKTDWTTFWTMVMTLILVLTAISTPVWITFAAVDKTITKQEKSIDKLEAFAVESVKDRAEMRAEIANSSSRILRAEDRIYK